MKFSNEVLFILSGLTALVIVALSIPSIIKVARAKNLYDYPDSRKAHRNSIPTLGGLAIFAALIVSVLLWTDSKSIAEIKYILAALVLIFFIGLKDDILVIAPDKKLIIQILAALILAILGDIRITNLHGFAGIYHIPYFISLMITVFVTIVVLNGMNLIDGIDGLASGVGIITSVTFGIYFYLVKQYQYVIFMSAVIGSLSAFFFYNVFGKKNKIFMGDTGSLIIGLILAVFAIKFNEFNLVANGGFHLKSAPSVSIGILMIPLFDTFRVFIIRLIKRKSPFKADNNHVHHKLLQIGCSHIQATLIIVGANLLFIGLAFILSNMGIIPLLLTLISVATVLSFIPSLMIYYQKNKYIKEPVIRRFPISNVGILLEGEFDKFNNYPSEELEESKEELEIEKIKVS